MAKRAQAARVNPPFDDRGPTKQRLEKAGKDFETGDTGVISVRDTPIDRALKRNLIDGKSYQAGIKFRHHWWHAGMAGKITSMDLNSVFATDLSTMGHMARSESEAFHRQKYREACQLLGMRAEMVVTDSVCMEIEFEKVGRKLGYGNDPQARAAATTLFQDALYRLTKLWGM